MKNERVVNNFMNYIKIDSESGFENNFASYLESQLICLGFKVEMDHAGEAFGGQCGNLIAKKSGTIKGRPLLFCAHMDTVSPGKNIRPLIKDGIISSDGTSILGGDDKAGIAAIVEGVSRFIESKKAHKDLELVFTVCEEGGINGGKNLDLSLIKAREGLILDSSKLPGEIIIQSPGQAAIDVIVYGKAAHAGVCPENGISAAQIFAEALSHMKLLRIDSETTANIGLVNGGVASNIVMPELKVKAEVRSLSLEKMATQISHMKSCFEKAAEKYAGHIDFKSTVKYKAFNLPEDASIVLKAKKAFNTIGIEASTSFTGGGSDANALNDRGLTMVNLGIGEKQAHTLEEHYYIKDLETMSTFVETFISQES